MPKVFGRRACRLTLRGAQEIAALHIEFEAQDDEPEMTPIERTAIFRAGALGESAPPCLHAAFARVLERRH
jgi:hypothetical protein